MRLGNAFYRRGIAKGDVQALDCAEFHFCMTRLSDYPDVRQKGEAMIQTIHQNLQKIARTGNEEQKRSARNLLDQIRISDLLDPYSAPVSAAEAEKLQLQEPNVREAFALAKDYQRRIDAIDAPKPFHIGSRIVKVPDGKGTLSMHAVVTGTRQEQGGKKEPVVILEPGLGCISSDWQLLQRSLPSDIAAISYDREGLGWSEKGAGQIASPERSMELLRSLLKEQGFSPPYVFVGHSYGGFLGQLFALNYPEEVAGLVLVDSALEDVAPIPNPPPESIFDYLPQASRARFVQNDRGDFLDAVEGYAVGAITGRTEQATTFEEEFGKALPHASDLLLAALSKNPKPFAMPVKVISAGIYLPDPRKSAAENAAAEQHWKAGQEKLKGRSSSLHSTHIVAPNSDHFIMYYDYNMIKDQIVSFYPRLGDNKGQS
jgi:pimeloyl-ACP methyl ester carboxylesterase